MTTSILTQIKSLKKSPLAALVGILFGGFVPIAVFCTSHYYVQARPYLWVFVAGGLVYSAKTVFQWAKAVFHDQTKAFGFVVFVEGTMTFVPGWLPFCALGVLVCINAIAAAYAIVTGQQVNKRKAAALKPTADRNELKLIREEHHAAISALTTAHQTTLTELTAANQAAMEQIATLRSEIEARRPKARRPKMQLVKAAPIAETEPQAQAI
jgi:hypothetical protein